MNLKTRNWSFLFSANFFGILNDNFLKNCIVFIGITWAIPSWLNLSQIITLVAAGLVLPYLIFSPLSGVIAIKYSKCAVFRWCKVVEFPILCIACIAFWKQWILVAIASVLLMGTQSCLYSPAKYGLIRDIGGEKGIPFGSGMFETVAFLGILSGTILASFMAEHCSIISVCFCFFVFALCGFFAVKCIKVKEIDSCKNQNAIANPLRFLMQSYHFAQFYPNVNLGVFGVSMFWLIGGIIQMNLIIHCKYALNISSTATGIVMALAAIGIALGCFFSGKIVTPKRRKKVVIGGLTGMIFFLLLILLSRPGENLFAVFIFLLAFSGGLFEVPCLTMVQQANIGRKIGDMLAYMNFVTFIFIFLGSVFFSLVTWLSHENSMAVFAVALGLCLVTTLVMNKYIQ